MSELPLMRKVLKVALGQIGPERVVERGTLTKMWLVHLTVMPEGEKH